MHEGITFIPMKPDVHLWVYFKQLNYRTFTSCNFPGGAASAGRTSRSYFVVVGPVTTVAFGKAISPVAVEVRPIFGLM